MNSKKDIFKNIGIFLLTLIFSSCQTISSLHSGGGGTIFIVKYKKYSEVWKSANHVVSQQLTIISAEKDLGVIKAEKGAGLFTWGEVVGVFISPTEESSPIYTVKVQSLKRSTYQITGQNWESTIVQGMKSELE